MISIINEFVNSLGGASHLNVLHVIFLQTKTVSFCWGTSFSP